jgi:hypothetical protein
MYIFQLFFLGPGHPWEVKGHKGAPWWGQVLYLYLYYLYHIFTIRKLVFTWPKDLLKVQNLKLPSIQTKELCHNQELISCLNWHCHVGGTAKINRIGTNLEQIFNFEQKNEMMNDRYCTESSAEVMPRYKLFSTTNSIFPYRKLPNQEQFDIFQICCDRIMIRNKLGMSLCSFTYQYWNLFIIKLQHMLMLRFQVTQKTVTRHNS